MRPSIRYPDRFDAITSSEKRLVRSVSFGTVEIRRIEKRESETIVRRGAFSEKSVMRVCGMATVFLRLVPPALGLLSAVNLAWSMLV